MQEAEDKHEEFVAPVDSYSFEVKVETNQRVVSERFTLSSFFLIHLRELPINESITVQGV